MPSDALLEEAKRLYAEEEDPLLAEARRLFAEPEKSVSSKAKKHLKGSMGGEQIDQTDPKWQRFGHQALGAEQSLVASADRFAAGLPAMAGEALDWMGDLAPNDTPKKTPPPGYDPRLAPLQGGDTLEGAATRWAKPLRERAAGFEEEAAKQKAVGLTGENSSPAERFVGGAMTGLIETGPKVPYYMATGPVGIGLDIAAQQKGTTGNVDVPGVILETAKMEAMGKMAGSANAKSVIGRFGNMAAIFGPAKAAQYLIAEHPENEDLLRGTLNALAEGTGEAAAFTAIGHPQAKLEAAKVAEIEAKGRDRAAAEQQKREFQATKEAERQGAEQEKAAKQNRQEQELADREQTQEMFQAAKQREVNQEIEDVARGAASSHPTPDAAAKAAQREVYDRRVAAGEIGIEAMKTAKTAAGYARDLHEMAQPAEMPPVEEGPPPPPNPSALNLLKVARPDQATARLVDQAILKGWDSLPEGQRIKIHEALQASGINPEAFAEAPLRNSAPYSNDSAWPLRRDPWSMAIQGARPEGLEMPGIAPDDPAIFGGQGQPHSERGSASYPPLLEPPRVFTPDEQLWINSGGLRGTMPPEVADLPTPQARHQQEIQGLEFDPRDLQGDPNAARQIPQQEGPVGEYPPGGQGRPTPEAGGGDRVLGETPGAAQREIDAFPEHHRAKATVLARQIEHIEGLREMGAKLSQDGQGNPVVRSESGRVIRESDLMKMKWDEPC